MKTIAVMILSTFLISSCAMMRGRCCKESCEKKMSCCKKTECKDAKCEKGEKCPEKTPCEDGNCKKKS